MLGHAYEMLLVGAMIVLAILIIVSIGRSVLGPGISDRVIAVNMIGTIIIMLIAILSLFLDEGYLVDVCLIYAMISFLGVVVLCKVYTGVYLQQKNMKANLGAVEDNLRRQEESVVSKDAGIAETAGLSAEGAAELSAENAAAEAETAAKRPEKAGSGITAEAGWQTTGGTTAPLSGTAKQPKEVR